MQDKNIYCLQQHRLIILCAMCLTFCSAKNARAIKKQASKDTTWMKTMTVLKGQALSFEDGIASISAQTKRAVLVDGRPTLKSSDWNMQGTTQGALDKYCERYHYSWTISKQGSILLRKRFDDPKELPQTHYPEMLQMTREIVSALSALPYDTNHQHQPEIFSSLYSSLTAPQLEWLHADKEISYNDLAPQQQKVVELAILNHSMAANLNNWQHLLDQLEVCASYSISGRIEQTAPSLESSPYDLLFTYKGATGGSLPLHGNFSRGNLTK